MTVFRIIGCGSARPLTGSWAIAALPPDACRSPNDLDASAIEWLPCEGPMPAAAALRAAGRWHLEEARNFDAQDWWYRCRFSGPDPSPRLTVRFLGLATIADAWLNGTHILHSRSMFVSHAVDIGDLVRDHNELLLRFHALGSLLAARRRRPAWRTALVAHQQLRCYRTSLIGRMATWWPAVAPVGPWRPVLIDTTAPFRIDRASVCASLDGDEGILQIEVEVCPLDARPSTGVLAIGGVTTPVVCEDLRGGGVTLRATARVPQVDRWWPHTHGPQPLYPVHLSIDAGLDTLQVDLGRVGFRTIDVERGPDGKGFGLVVNGVQVFCRGVCWTPLDIARLGAEAADYRRALEQLRDAGMNMVRLPGTMVYETDDFYDLCDELGMLVWQDFMFANMDYPSPHDDDEFDAAVALEARQLLEALQGRPSLAVCCGNSEVEQQAAMMGQPRGQWTNALFSRELHGVVRSLASGTAWLPSTPTGGAFPFQANHGVSHYYGVGAYRRGLDDARRAGVRFAAECLAFSNIPDKAAMAAAEGQHQESSLLRVPRDAGADWDFEHVRDHYVEQLFGVDAAALRARDRERYYALGRVGIGEVMLRTFAEWRRPGSSCRGGLVWFARDFSYGAGWGIVDASGRAKSVYWYLKRALAPVALLGIDEGLNGFWLYAVNDSPDRIEAELCLGLYRDGCPSGTPVSTTITVPGRSTCSVHADGLFDEFRDTTNAYRFEPRGHDVIAATLRHPASGDVLASTHCFPYGLPAERQSGLTLAAHATPVPGGHAVVLEANRFAYAVVVESPGHVPDDNYLNLEPGQPRTVILRAAERCPSLRGSVTALNAVASAPIVWWQGAGNAR
jgi:beta-mannosidase